MKFKKFIGTLITVATIGIAVGALVKRILIHGDDLKNIVKRKHDVIKDVGVKTSGKKETETEGVRKNMDGTFNRRAPRQFNAPNNLDDN